MKKPGIYHLLCLTLILFGSLTIFGQQPAWIDYAKRTSSFPESDYLVGFVSAHNSNEEDPGKLMDQYEELAKIKVIQSIQVSIETNNSLTLSNVNGNSDEEFESKSISFSSATITGLKTERYYDTKKKNVYAFAYVSKKELAFYNRKLITSNLQKIEQKLNEGRNYLQLNDKQNALKSFYEGMPLLSEAEEAQWLLMAVNREQFIEKDLNRIRENKIELNNAISRLQQSKGLNSNEAAYFIAYGLFVQIGKPALPLITNLYSFENTGLTSEFSDQWDTEIKNALVKTGNYTIQDQPDSESKYLELKGNYWEEGDQLRIQAQVFNENKLAAVAEGSISLAWLKAEKIGYLPEQLIKIDQLQNFKLRLITSPEQAKIGLQSDSKMTVMVERVNLERATPLENIPVIFSLKNGKRIADGISNSKGLVSVYFPAISIAEGKTEIITQIDLATYVDIDTNSVYYLRLKKKNPVAPAVFTIQLKPIIYYVNTKETIDKRPVDIKIIEPQLKTTLANEGYQFADKESDADFIISIIAETTAGNTYQGIYFSYVDATISIINTASGLETFKAYVEQVKAGGSNSKKAGIKALNLAAEQLNQALIEFLSVH